MTGKFERFNRRVGGWLEWIGVIAMLVMMFTTSVDVLLAKLLTSPMQGAIDMVMFSQLIAIAFALAMSIILGRHIQVEFIIARFPRRAQAVIEGLVALLGFGFFALIVWQLYLLGHAFQTAGEKSMSQLRFSIYPFPYAIALACIAPCLIFLQRFLNSFIRVFRE